MKEIKLTQGKVAKVDDHNDAARAYNKAIIVHHGEFARLNEIPA